MSRSKVRKEIGPTKRCSSKAGTMKISCGILKSTKRYVVYQTLLLFEPRNIIGTTLLLGGATGMTRNGRFHTDLHCVQLTLIQCAPTNDAVMPNPSFNVDAPHIAPRARTGRVTKRACLPHHAAARQLTLR